MPPVKLDALVDDGDKIAVGKLELEVWHTPGHTDSQLSFRLGDLLFSGDNIYRDGCVGAIDAHHGSDIPAFIESLKRIRASDVEWLLPSHGPIFRKDNALLDKAIARLEGYLHMADFGTCAIDWPLMDEWDKELAAGKMPQLALASLLSPRCIAAVRALRQPHSNCSGSNGYSLNTGCTARRCLLLEHVSRTCSDRLVRFRLEFRRAYANRPCDTH